MPLGHRFHCHSPTAHQMHSSYRTLCRPNQSSVGRAHLSPIPRWHETRSSGVVLTDQRSRRHPASFEGFRKVQSYFAQRRAHVPLGAGARVTHGFGVVVTGNHLNETAPSGYVARLVVLSFCKGLCSRKAMRSNSKDRFAALL